MRCGTATDCVSKKCQSGYCVAATCTDLIQNGSETDVDCGGGCPVCGNGLKCLGGTDCASKVCTAGRCAAPSCTDGVQNGTETDLNCGGGACPGCTPGLHCLSYSDCDSWVCAGNVCQAPTCSDGVQNGDEQAVDCGGSEPGCPPCPTSCPLVFSFAGAGFSYETDLMGAALDAANVSNTSVPYITPRYLPLSALVPDPGGLLQVKLRESLPESAYLDEVKLLAVDHPDGTEVYTSSGAYTAVFGYSVPFALYTAGHAVIPQAAVTSSGEDVLAAVAALDGVPAPLGRVPDFSYTFDFGPIAHPENAKLLIDSWTVLRLPSSGIGKVQPSVQVSDGQGGWVTVATFGLPAGDLKGVVVPIPDAFISSDQRVRVVPGGTNNASWVIDRIRLDDSDPVAVTTQEIAPLVGDLHYRGAAALNKMTLLHRMWATDTVIADNPAAFGFGAYTGYGDVGPLLLAPDDMFAIMRYADELSLSFSPPPPAAPGLTRTYLLKVDLYYKGFTQDRQVDPLPFHAMTAYPPPPGESYPTDQAHQDYLANYETRVCTP
jgi:hypothetical protein